MCLWYIDSLYQHTCGSPWQVSVEGAGPVERAQLQYQLSDTENFGIDEAGIIYNLRRLDHERSGGRYTLQVTAEQRGKWEEARSGWGRVGWGENKNVTGKKSGALVREILKGKTKWDEDGENRNSLNVAPFLGVRWCFLLASLKERFLSSFPFRRVMFLF